MQTELPEKETLKKAPEQPTEKSEIKPRLHTQPALRWRTMSSWQRRYMGILAAVYVLVFGVYLLVTASSLYKDRIKEGNYWGDTHTTSEETKAQVEQCAKTAVVVQCGSYVESLDQLSLRDSSYSLTMEIWFSWQGEENLNMADHFRIYAGSITNKELLRDVHRGKEHYQRLRVTATMNETYWTKRFPLDSHLLSCFIESEYPAQQVLLEADTENSGWNSFMEITGYEVTHIEQNNHYFLYQGNHGDPDLQNGIFASEMVTSIAIRRSSLGLYAKCFIALVGTVTWVLIAMYINTYHHVDPLSMIPAALFGTVSNIMVGASLLPDALQMGLLEYVNILGIMIILAATVSIISVNYMRTHYQDRAFAERLGRVLLGIVTFFAVVGNVLLPLVSYRT